MRIWSYLPASPVLLLCCIPLLAQSQPQKDLSQNTQVLIARDVSSQSLKSVATDPNYSIGSEDVLTVDVWKEPEISRTVQVRRDGKISLPLLDDVQAAGVTPKQLGSEIASRLHEIIVNPQVTVIVAQMSSQRIYILGQVTRGGAYPLVPDMTALQALSVAGGFTPFANLKKIYVMRTENGDNKVFPINYKEVVNQHGAQQNILLKPGDTIVVP